MKIFGPISCIWTWNETRPLEKSKDPHPHDHLFTLTVQGPGWEWAKSILRLINAFYYLRFLPQPHWVKSPIQYQPFTHCNRCLYQYKISWNLRIMVIFSVLQNMENKWWNVRSCCNFYKCIFIHTRARAHERESTRRARVILYVYLFMAIYIYIYYLIYVHIHSCIYPRCYS